MNKQRPPNSATINRLPIFVLFFWALVIAFAGDARPEQASPSSREIAFKEVSLASLPTACRVIEIQVSADNGHLGITFQRGTNVVVCLDGAEMGEDHEARDLLFSPDGLHFAFVGRRGARVVLVRDCVESKVYEDIGKGCVLFSPDSQHLACIARDQGKWRAVLDGAPGKGYSRIARVGISFSPDGKHLAYSAIDTNCLMVVDEREEVVCDGLGVVNFSTNSSHHGYVVPRGDDWLVVLDGKAKEFARVLTNGVIFSPNGHRSLYCAAQAKEKLRVYVDGVPSKEFDQIGAGLLAFSPDSRHVAYAGKRGSKWVVMFDDKESSPVDGIMGHSLTFSPDSEHFAYAAQRGNQWFVIRDGTESHAYEGIGAGSLTFSPDSRHLAFLGGRERRLRAVLDGEEQEPYSEVGAQDLVFSPDSRQFMYVARDAAGWHVVLNGKPGKAYQGIAVRPFCFTPDAQHIAFVASQGGKFVLIAGGQESSPWDQFLFSPQAGNTFKTGQLLATKKDEVCLKFVRLQIEPRLQ